MISKSYVDMLIGLSELLYYSGKQFETSKLNCFYLIFFCPGYVCQRPNLMKNGCCDPDADFTKKYSCETCMNNNCCVIYEYCVSCCLDPSKVRIYI